MVLKGNLFNQIGDEVIQLDFRILVKTDSDALCTVDLSNPFQYGKNGCYNDDDDILA